MARSWPHEPGRPEIASGSTAMIDSQPCPASDARRQARSRGFTLIEVLVVVAIIALLVSVLLPALSKARENARRAVCSAQLGEMAKAMIMYNNENRDYLPGPLHQALELETVAKVAVADWEAWHLPFYIRRYFSDRSARKQLTDKVLKCPTSLMITGGAKNVWSNTDQQRPFTYALNNWWYIANERQGTDPQQYFGWPGSSSNTALNFWTGGPDANGRFQLNPAAGPIARPKRISLVRQHSREWAIADAFRYTDQNRPPLAGAGRPHGDWRLGTYQSDWVERANIPLPTSPYHSKGINVGMFDGHVEWQRPWWGSVNPYKP